MKSFQGMGIVHSLSGFLLAQVECMCMCVYEVLAIPSRASQSSELKRKVTIPDRSNNNCRCMCTFHDNKPFLRVAQEFVAMKFVALMSLAVTIIFLPSF